MIYYNSSTWTRKKEHRRGPISCTELYNVSRNVRLTSTLLISFSYNKINDLQTNQILTTDRRLFRSNRTRWINNCKKKIYHAIRFLILDISWLQWDHLWRFPGALTFHISHFTAADTLRNKTLFAFNVQIVIAKNYRMFFIGIRLKEISNVKTKLGENICNAGFVFT